MRNEFNLIILNEGKRLAKFINDVLDLSRMETGRIALNKSKVNIVKLIKKMIDNGKEALSSINVILTLEAPYDEIIIEADEERLLQALDSLLENSIKFSKKTALDTYSFSGPIEFLSNSMELSVR